MDRKKFLKNSTLGLALFPFMGVNNAFNDSSKDCTVTPSEIQGPFPNKKPKQYITENIIGNRVGIPLLINLCIKNVNANCTPVKDVFVDIWQCDSKGNYSEYKYQLDGDFTSNNFLRGRQLTDKNGEISFISIYPGWYPGRSPHLHIEVLTKKNKSLLITQIAFPENISTAVYNTMNYKGIHDTVNKLDYEFRGSLENNLADSIIGNLSQYS